MTLEFLAFAIKALMILCGFAGLLMLTEGLHSAYRKHQERRFYERMERITRL